MDQADMNPEKLIPLESRRLLIDRFIPADWIEYYKIENSPEQHRYNREAFHPMTEAETIAFIKDTCEVDYSKCTLPMLFAIRMKKTEKLIGFIGLKNGELRAGGSLEVYYSIHKDHWNRGYATEALKRMIEFGFNDLSLHRIFSGCDADNIASKKVMENAGMKFESRWRKDRMRNGEWTDGLGYAILEEDLAQK
jgi:RimJ/RimL family protein N-acetyltransferase